MDFNEAMDARVTGDEAVREMDRHGFVADTKDGELFDCVSGETVAKAGEDGLYAGSAVLGWLGY